MSKTLTVTSPLREGEQESDLCTCYDVYTPLETAATSRLQGRRPNNDGYSDEKRWVRKHDRSADPKNTCIQLRQGLPGSAPCVTVPSCTSPIVSQSHCVPVPLCPRPIVSQSHFVPGPFRPSPIGVSWSRQRPSKTGPNRRCSRQKTGRERGPSPWSSHFPRKATCSSARTTERSASSTTQAKSCRRSY